VFTDTDAGGAAPSDFQRAAADADVLLAVELTSPATVAAVAEAASGRTVFLAFDAAAQLQSLIRLKDYRAEDGGILQRVAQSAPWTQTAKDRFVCVQTHIAAGDPRLQCGATVLGLLAGAQGDAYALNSSAFMPISCLAATGNCYGT